MRDDVPLVLIFGCKVVRLIDTYVSITGTSACAIRNLIEKKPRIIIAFLTSFAEVLYNTVITPRLEDAASSDIPGILFHFVQSRSSTDVRETSWAAFKGP